MLSRWDDAGVDIELIGKNRTSPLGLGNSLPELAGSGFGTISDGVGHNLTGTPTLGGLQPAFEPFLPHETDQLIHLQHVSSLSWQQAVTQTGQGFQQFSQPAQHRHPPHPEHPLQPPQAHPFPVGLHDLCLLLCAVSFFGSKHPVTTTPFAMVLLISALFRPLGIVWLLPHDRHRYWVFSSIMWQIAFCHHLLCNHYPESVKRGKLLCCKVNKKLLNHATGNEKVDMSNLPDGRMKRPKRVCPCIRIGIRPKPIRSCNWQPVSC